FRLESNTSHRPSREISKASIVWFPFVTGWACETETALVNEGRIDHTFDVSVKAEYASRVPSADTLMLWALRPVVTRRGGPAGVPARVRPTWYTSRPPSRFEIYSSDQPAWHAAQGGDDLDAARRGEEEPLSVGGPRGEPLLALVRNDADGQPSVHLAHEQVGTPRPPRDIGDESAIRRQGGVELEARV